MNHIFLNVLLIKTVDTIQAVLMETSFPLACKYNTPHLFVQRRYRFNESYGSFFRLNKGYLMHMFIEKEIIKRKMIFLIYYVKLTDSWIEHRMRTMVTCLLFFKRSIQFLDVVFLPCIFKAHFIFIIFYSRWSWKILITF